MGELLFEAELREHRRMLRLKRIGLVVGLLVIACAIKYLAGW